MQVILTKEVDALGEQGDLVQVADGYARNYLFPNNMAIQATSGALADLERRRERIRAKAEKKHQEDLKKAEAINAVGQITLEAFAGEEGKLFGTITTKELAKVLQAKVGFEIDRRTLTVSHPIHRVGDYQLTLKFSAKVSAGVILTVIPTAVENLSEEYMTEDYEEEE
jgi:large subunit ribosomal protein L9